MNLQKSFKRNGICHSKFTKYVAILVFLISHRKNIERKEITLVQIIFLNQITAEK